MEQTAYGLRVDMDVPYEQALERTTAAQNDLADALGFEIRRRGEILVPPSHLGAFLETDEAAAKLVAVGETQQVRGLFRGGGCHHAQACDERLILHFS